ncbi:hypothetical protein [Streptomyces atratus]
MPTVFQQLAAHREISALRNVLDCSLDASVLREGAVMESGRGPAWLMFLCPAHAEELPEWPGAATHTDTGSMSCGTVLDYRSTEEMFQSHADLWLTPLTGVRPDAFGGVWSEVLNEADRVLVARLEREADGDGEGEVLQGMLAMMDLACRSGAEDNLTQAATSLVLCETLALRL